LPENLVKTLLADKEGGILLNGIQELNKSLSNNMPRAAIAILPGFVKR
jgi:hypothetical protein